MSGTTNHLEHCPLCGGQRTGVEALRSAGREFYICGHCSLIFVDKAFHLCAGDEKARYETHCNNILDEGYVAFLSRIITPSIEFLEPGMRGLDFGCGPGPTLSRILELRGFPCDDYDPFFVPEPPRPPYDFIFSTECLEHFTSPGIEIGNICSMLKKGGILCIMTELWATTETFEGWYYARDPSHVSFYHLRTLDFIRDFFRLEDVWNDGSRCAIFRKL
ncbi:MAG: class I SAM-dependent methyltransferase [Victivallales bacterium]|nr:class I SAM-dependent methyltransferase [Victivallales bacterium]